MPRRSINPDGIKDPSSLYYSHINIDGDQVFVSGQIGVDEDNKLVSKDFAPQARKAFENLGVILEELDKDFSDVAKIRSFIVDAQANYDEYVDVWTEFFSQPYPCATAIGAAELAKPGLLIEIEAEFRT